MSPIIARRLLMLAVPVSASLFAHGFDAFAKTHHLSRSLAGWNTDERAMMRSLSLASLQPLAPDPSNRYADDPAAAALGQALFSDTRLSSNGRVSCASCHVAAQEFQDGTPLGHGVGVTARRTMPIAGTAHGAWFFWDGRADSQWSQALGPLESAVEHGGTRAQYARVIAEHYRDEYARVFGPLPPASGDQLSRVYANIGKAIAAFERGIEYGPSRFDRYVDVELAEKRHSSADAFTRDEEAGLRLFIGKGSCTNCHNGALLSDNHFHNTGIPPESSAAVDSGRTVGIRKALAAEFSCTSRYSDAKAEDCDELRFAPSDGPELAHAFKTPSLRNVANRRPYMDAGQLKTLEDVVAHYDRAAPADVGKTELKPLHLSSTEREQLVAFLKTLSGPTVVRQLGAPPR
ncbi:MAG TPA: cytochrome c peroxidase [Gemmatimonadaceae bacterium]|jgi:cytochrome c peroxidase